MIFRYQYLKVYRNSINTKNWVKDVIQGFAQKAVKLNKNVIITRKIGEKDKTGEIPRNSRRNFRNSREFPPGILGSAIPGNSRTGIPEREFPLALSHTHQLKGVM